MFLFIYFSCAFVALAVFSSFLSLFFFLLIFPGQHTWPPAPLPRPFGHSEDSRQPGRDSALTLPDVAHQQGCRVCALWVLVPFEELSPVGTAGDLAPVISGPRGGH